MTRHIRKFTVILSTPALMLVGPDAFAGMGGGSISYSPFAESVPTLSAAMLVVLAFLFAVLALRTLRAYPGGKPLASLLAVGVLVLAAASGNQFIRSAQAVIGYAFDSPGGGVVVIGSTFEVPVTNITGRPQRIISVTPDPGGIFLSTVGSPQCVSGLVVQQSSTCYVYFQPPPP